MKKEKPLLRYGSHRKSKVSTTKQEVSYSSRKFSTHTLRNSGRYVIANTDGWDSTAQRLQGLTCDIHTGPWAIRSPSWVSVPLIVRRGRAQSFSDVSPIFRTEGTWVFGERLQVTWPGLCCFVLKFMGVLYSILWHICTCFDLNVFFPSQSLESNLCFRKMFYIYPVALPSGVHAPQSEKPGTCLQ